MSTYVGSLQRQRLDFLTAVGLNVPLEVRHFSSLGPKTSWRERETISTVTVQVHARNNSTPPRAIELGRRLGAQRVPPRVSPPPALADTESCPHQQNGNRATDARQNAVPISTNNGMPCKGYTSVFVGVLRSSRVYRFSFD